MTSSRTLSLSTPYSRQDACSYALVVVHQREQDVLGGSARTRSPCDLRPSGVLSLLIHPPVERASGVCLAGFDEPGFVGQHNGCCAVP
jgi:hypothetical protein